MTIEVLDPSYDERASALEPAARLERVAGTTLGIVSNGKRGTVGFFDALEAELRDRYDVAEVIRVVKPDYSAPAGDEIMDAAQTWHAVIAGIGD